METVLASCEQLVAAQRYSSAVTTLSFIRTSLLKNSKIHASTLVKVCSLYGEALIQLSEYKYAMVSLTFIHGVKEMFSEASRYLKMAKETGWQELENQFKLNIARAAFKAKDYEAVIHQLMSISGEDRTLEMNSLLFDVYKITQDVRNGLEVAWLILRENPYAIDVISYIISQKVPAEELIDFLQLTNVPSWVLALTQAQYKSKHYEYESAHALYSELEEEFPCNQYLMLEKAKLNYECGNVVYASNLFAQIRRMNSYFINGMDIYADLILEHQKEKFPRLCKDLLELSHDKPETWVTLGKWCLSKKDYATALSMAEKALSIHPSYLEAYILRATAFAQYKHLDISLNVWKKAYRHEKSNRVYQGLVQTLIALDKPTEALVFAKEALQSYPKNLKAAALLGFVLSKLPDQRTRAKLVLKSILSNQPDNTEANKYLVDIYQEEKNYPEAILLLEGQIKSQPTAELYTRLANFYFWNQDMGKANMYYNAALGLNVNYEPAQKGIKQIEETMIGESMREEMSSDDLEEMITDEYTFG